MIQCWIIEILVAFWTASFFCLSLIKFQEILKLLEEVYGRVSWNALDYVNIRQTAKAKSKNVLWEDDTTCLYMEPGIKKNVWQVKWFHDHRAMKSEILYLQIHNNLTGVYISTA